MRFTFFDEHKKKQLYIYKNNDWKTTEKRQINNSNYD